MANYVERNFKDEVVVLDGNSFTRCRFDDCKVIFEGGPPPNLSDCTFDRCSWLFDGAALRTIRFIAALKGGGLGELQEAMIDAIRAGGLKRYE